MNQHEYSVNDDGWVSFRTVRPQPGRKYYNHLAKHTRGEWHRNWLLTSGMYIKTSERRWKIVGEAGPELVKTSIETKE